MHFTVPIYQKKESGDLVWITLGLGEHGVQRSGHRPLELERAIVGELKKKIAELPPRDLERFQMARGMRLERVHLELTLRGAKKRKVSGVFPLVLEPRWTSDEHRIVAAYHPFRQKEWFPASDTWPLDEQATMFFQKVWADIDDEELASLVTAAKDVIKSLSFSARPKTLLDQLPDRPKGLWEDLIADPTKDKAASHPPQGSLQVLPKIAINQTIRALEGVLPSGTARSPYREQLQLLLCGEKKRSVIVVGPPGCGKSTIVARWIEDLVASDDYESHRNLDRLHEVWLVSGKRIIAGMSYVGDWEQRCIDLLQDTKRRRVILLVEDIHAFGRIGQTRHSDRNLADFFRGPIARGELVLVGECTPEQLQRLEDDAPSFAALFTRVHVHPTTAGETLRMVMHHARGLEQNLEVAFDPFTFRTVLELGGSLFSGAAFPGKALDLIRDLAKEVAAEAASDERPKPWRVTPKDVISSLAKKTGFPELLLEPAQRLDAGELRRELERSVMGQRAAVEAACDLILRIKAGLTDPHRPYGVYLFTGPTGTGKTELATSIATYLYGDASRLIRFDMSEFGSPDATVRLIGDRFSPEGLLTQQVQDQPFSVVLLDEIEKAHPSVLNLLLQLFDEGRLTDAKGSTADFRHAVIIMTSNLGAKERAAVGFQETPDAVLHDIARAVRDFFPPELFNRIDRVVPFRPLTQDIARRIAEKELSRLVARRGLTGRSIFVYANDAVFDRIVREAFDPKDGARPVKRWVEKRIGSLLTEEIVKQPQSAWLQIFRVFDAAGAFRLHAERLVEAEAKTASSALEPLLDLPAAELKKKLPAALAFVRELLDSEELATVSEQIGAHLSEYNLGKREHDDVIYNLESLRLHLLHFREEMELSLEGEAHRDPELVEVEQFTYRHDANEDGPYRQRLFDRRQMKPTAKPLLKDDLLAALAEAHFLRRALKLVHDPGQHAVFIELLRVGRARDPGRFRAIEDADSRSLLESLAQAYLAGRGTVESHAIREEAGDLISGTGSIGEAETAFGSAEHVVLKVIGLCVLELYADEQGSHIAQSLRTGTELVRVRVWPATPGVTPAGIIEQHQQERRAFERALESGARELPPNPEALLPAVRTLRFEAPEREGVAPLVEVEDYVLGYSTRLRAKTLGEILKRLWLLRMGRDAEAS